MKALSPFGFPIILTDARPGLEEALARRALTDLVLGRKGLAFVSLWLDTIANQTAAFNTYKHRPGNDPRAMRHFVDALVEAAAEPDAGWVTA